MIVPPKRGCNLSELKDAAGLLFRPAASYLLEYNKQVGQSGAESRNRQGPECNKKDATNEWRLHIIT